jgi:hypothetical protein
VQKVREACADEQAILEALGRLEKTGHHRPRAGDWQERIDALLQKWRYYMGEERPPPAFASITTCGEAQRAVDALLRELAPEGEPPKSVGAARQLSKTERRILAHCRRKAHIGERIALHLGLSKEHTRRLLARLVREGRLRNTDRGYRTV